jgi:hypothetical protein
MVRTVTSSSSASVAAGHRLLGRAEDLDDVEQAVGAAHAS